MSLVIKEHWVSDTVDINCCTFSSENIVTEHHYTPDFITAAAVAANAGTCLEDGNGHTQSNNVFQNLDDAYNKVGNNLCLSRPPSYICSFIGPGYYGYTKGCRESIVSCSYAVGRV